MGPTVLEENKQESLSLNLVIKLKRNQKLTLKKSMMIKYKFSFMIMFTTVATSVF